jgi:hypothetical protein
MVQDGNNHWLVFSKNLSETRNVCFNQCRNADESWLYPLEVGRGVLDGALKYTALAQYDQPWEIICFKMQVG